MIIDNDDLVWTRIISIYPFSKDNSKITHLVKYYKNEFDKEYYIFKYKRTGNNDNISGTFNDFYWIQIIHQIDFSDNCYIYSQLGNDKNTLKLITSGKKINIAMQKYIKKYELEHHQ